MRVKCVFHPSEIESALTTGAAQPQIYMQYLSVGRSVLEEGRVWLFTVEYFLAIIIKCIAMRRGIEKEDSIAGW